MDRNGPAPASLRFTRPRPRSEERGEINPCPRPLRGPAPFPGPHTQMQAATASGRRKERMVWETCSSRVEEGNNDVENLQQPEGEERSEKEENSIGTGG